MTPTGPTTSNPSEAPHDPLLARLAELPAVPVDPAAAEALRRTARAALLEPATPPPLLARLSLTWAELGLPAVLLVSGAAYTWSSAQLMGRIFIGSG